MTKTQNPTPGTTVHVLHNTKYMGAYEVTEVEEAESGVILHAGRYAIPALLEDLFDTEADAKAAAQSRRAPRQVRQPCPLYGDYAQLAAFNGIATDGTGRRVRRP